MFVGFTVEDPARAQLMFMRSIPGFEPSAEAYEVAVRIVERSKQRMAKLGVTKSEDFDLWTGLVSGLSFQQIANEPGTQRWARLVDQAVDMFLDHVNKQKGRRK
jgi:hypothetical protein